MAYIRKTVDRWDIMGNYGYGWECECSEYTFKEAKQRLKEYRENGGGCYRLEKHREKKEVQIINNPTIVNQNGEKNIRIEHLDVLNL